MKRILLIMTVAIVAIAGATVYNLCNADAQCISISEYRIDLNQNENMCDLVFDKDGNFLAGATYQWNSSSDTKGQVIATLVK